MHIISSTHENIIDENYTTEKLKESDGVISPVRGVSQADRNTVAKIVESL